MRSSITIFSILAMLTLSSCSSEKKAEQSRNAAIPVRIGGIRHVQDHELISVSGTVASPDAPAGVSFLVSGKVVQVGPREGEYVQKGQLMAAIDPTDYTLAVQAASAQVGQARIALERTRDEYGRMKFLFESRSLPANDFEKFKAACMTAKQQLDQAVANEKLSQKRLTDASLYAPVSGFISKRAIEPGETAGPGRPVFEIVKLDPVEISVGVPETDIHLVRIGQTAALKIPALPGEEFQGTVRVINVSADPGTRTYMTRITVPNPGHILRVGMVAVAQIQGDRILDIMTLPAEAIVRDPQGATVVFVYYPDRKCVYARRVGVGTAYGREISIKSGLSGDESIVLAGQEKLRDGISVSVTAENAPEGTIVTPGATEERK
jgi:membrane fusion protein (multidrug efflux system)